MEQKEFQPAVYPHSLKFHKKTAQLDVKIIRPSKDDIGCWMLQVAKPLPNQEKMNWENSIIMKFSLVDAAELFYAFKREAFPMKLFHKNAKGSTTLDVAKTEAGGYWFNFSSVRDTVQNKISVGLYEKETDLLLLALKQTIPTLLNWT